MNTITISYEQLTSIIRASQIAFIDSGKYLLTKSEADDQFGGTLINTLISNKLLKDSRPLKRERLKCRFLLTDIITAIEAFNNQ